MAAYTETVELKDHTVGDAWVGIGAIGPVKINSQTPGESLTRVVLTFRLGSSIFTLDSDDGEVTISDASTWLCAVPAMDSFLPRAGTWKFDIEFYRQGHATPWTLYAGEIKVHDDVD